MDIIQFGKYKGDTYEQVLLKNKRYCCWIGAQITESEEVKAFQLWLLEKGLITEMPARSNNHNSGK